MPQKKQIVSRELGCLMLCVEEIRKVFPSMTANSFQAFLIVATEPGLKVGEIGHRLALGSSATVRVLASLSPHHRGGKEGLGLLDYETDIRDRRVRYVSLSHSGQRVFNSIRRIMEAKR